MIALEVFGERASLECVVGTLDRTDGVSHVTCIDATRPLVAGVAGMLALETRATLGVLGVNVLMMVVGAVGTLLLQRAISSRPRTHH